MTAFTAYLGLYLPGGGSSGIGGDDEAVDVDKLNGNFQAIDASASSFNTRITTAESSVAELSELGPLRGTGAERAATDSAYWKFWQDTDGDQHLYVGNKSGGWRRFSGKALDAEKAWATTSGTAMAGRTNVFTLPTVLESNETLMVQIDPSVSTSGYNFVGVTGLIRNPTNTQVNVRFMQILSTTTQPMPIVWQIVQVGA